MGGTSAQKLNASNRINLISSLPLESVYLDSRFFDAILNEEVGNLATLVSLELYDLTQLLVVNEGAVAGKFLLKGFEKFLRIVLFGQALQGGQGLPPIPLLNTDVDVICLRSNVLAVSERVSLVCKGIECIEVLHAHAMVREGSRTEWGMLMGERRGGRKSERWAIVAAVEVYQRLT